MQESVLDIFGKTNNVSINRTKVRHSIKKQPWFNKDCAALRKEFNTARNKFLRDKTIENKLSFLK